MSQAAPQYEINMKYLSLELNLSLCIDNLIVTYWNPDFSELWGVHSLPISIGGKLTMVCRGHIFSHVRPFYEWAVSNLDL